MSYSNLYQSTTAKREITPQSQKNSYDNNEVSDSYEDFDMDFEAGFEEFGDIEDSPEDLKEKIAEFKNQLAEAEYLSSDERKKILQKLDQLGSRAAGPVDAELLKGLDAELDLLEDSAESKALGSLEKTIKDSHLGELAKAKHLEKIEAAKAFSNDGEFDLSGVGEASQAASEIKELDQILKAEKTRTIGIEQDLVNRLDEMFLAQPIRAKESKRFETAAKGAGAGALGGVAAGAVTGALIGSVVPGAGTAIGAVVGAVWGAIGGSVVGGISGTIMGKESQGPESELKNAPKSIQDLHIVLGPNSGLVGSTFPGDVAKLLYSTDMGPGDMRFALEKMMSSTQYSHLKPIEKSAMLAVVLNQVAKDPTKMDVLRSHFSPVLNFMKERMQADMGDLNGMTGEYSKPGYEVIPDGSGGFKIKNLDTSLFRNDWNDFEIEGIDNIFNQAMSTIDRSSSNYEYDMPDAPDILEVPEGAEDE